MTTKSPASSRNVALRVPTALHDALRHAANINGLTLNGYIKFIAARAVREEAKQVEAA
jgi:uncharacterized protein (DUF1778 family)